MRVIGITGGVGSGKSRILDILKQEYGAEVIEADRVAKLLMEPGEEGYECLKRLYGDELLTEDGSIDRAWLSEKMFHDPDVLKTVNGIIHPMVWETIRQRIRESQSSLVVVEAALPDENHRDIYSELWYVYTSEENRIRRLSESRGYSREKSRSMMDNQLGEAEFKAMADVVIDNNGSLEETRRQIASRL